MVTTRSSSKRQVATPSPAAKKTKVADVRHMNFDLKSKSLNSVIHLQLKQDDICDIDSDAVAIPINQRINHASSNFLRKFIDIVGDDSYSSKVAECKNKAGKIKGGDVLHVDMSQSIACPWKHIFLIVLPVSSDTHTFTNAFKSMLEQCSTLKVTSLVCTHFTGRGKSLDKIALSTLTALLGILSLNDFGCLKIFTLCDMKCSVVDMYSHHLSKMINKNVLSTTAKLVIGTPLPTVSKEEREGRKVTNRVLPESVVDDDCVLCLEELKVDGGPEVCELRKCAHQFHFNCFLDLSRAVGTKKRCPTCRRYFALPRGSQPRGSMRVTEISQKLPGFSGSSGTYTIIYSFPNGIQEDSHIRPGLPFTGTERIAYLPKCEEGDKVLRLLRKAFELRLIFTVGDSVTTGAQNVVTWTNIHHKTSMYPGPFGYPDDSYIGRVLAELGDAGVSEELFSQ